jgi:hypothetical protein
MRKAFPALALLALCSCLPSPADFSRQFAPGVADDSHVHAFQAASFAYAFLNGNETQWQARLAAAERDLPAFYDALGKSGCRADFAVVAHQNTARNMSYEYYGVTLVLVPRSGQGARFQIPGDPGTDPDAYLQALAPAAAACGLAPETAQKGHFALFALATMSGALNATEDAMRRYAFGLLVLQEELTRKVPNADFLAPVRPPDKSLEDVQLALRVIADHHAATSDLRGEVLAVTALARDAEVAEARAAMLAQIGDGKKHAQEWLSTHHQPTQQEFGVAMKKLVLPTPDAMLAVLDKDGYVTAALTIARGVTTGSPGTTIQGLGKLAPANSSLRIASEGTAAALRGDVGGAADAILALADKNEDLAPTVARVRSVQQAVQSARSGVGDALSTVSDPKRALTPH